MSFTATLPYPPTINHYWVLGKGRIYVSPAGRQYRRRVGAILQGAPKFTGPLSVVIWVGTPDKRKRDLDNILKCLLDALTVAQVWIDDSQIEQLGILKDHELKNEVRLSIVQIVRESAARVPSASPVSPV